MTHTHLFKRTFPGVVSCKCGITMKESDKERIDRENLPSEVEELFGTLRPRK